MDDGEYGNSNRSYFDHSGNMIESFEDEFSSNANTDRIVEPFEFHLDKQEGITVGGVPQFQIDFVSRVDKDLYDCESIVYLILNNNYI